MKNQKNTPLSTCILFLLLVAFQGISFAQTQQEMTQCAYNEKIKTEAKLDSLYNLILEHHASDSTFINNFENAQSAWLTHVNSDISLMLPEHYGSYVLCSLSIVNQHLEKRIDYLKQWTDGIIEGDVCTGSREIALPKTLEKIEITGTTKERCEEEIVQKEFLGGVQIGNSYTDVSQTIGKPDTIYTYLGPYDELFVNWTYKEKGLELIFYVDYFTNGEVRLVDATCTKAFLSTGMNAKVGDTFKDFQKAYGQIVDVYYDKSTLKDLIKKDTFKITLGNESGIEFEFENGKVTQIFLSDYWGPWC